MPGQLEAALEGGGVVKTTIMRMTLHLVAHEDYPAYHQLTRQTRVRKWRKDYTHLDEEKVVAELGAWLREPRTNNDIRERDVGSGRVLALERCEQADRLGRVEPAALEQHLARGQRRGQLLAAEDPLAQLEESVAVASRTTSPILAPCSASTVPLVSRRCWYSERCMRAMTSRCTWAVPSNSW